MAWPLQNTAQWNPTMGMTPDMNVGPYTVKEWSDMQQHNWQQWAQWQQQYTQWHHQYGDKVMILISFDMGLYILLFIEKQK